MGRATARAVLRVGDLELDPAATPCTGATAAIDLTAKELALLEYFMRHPGEVAHARAA